MKDESTDISTFNKTNVVIRPSKVVYTIPNNKKIFRDKLLRGKDIVSGKSLIQVIKDHMFGLKNKAKL